jgi:hypothetical protein
LQHPGANLTAVAGRCDNRGFYIVSFAIHVKPCAAIEDIPMVAEVFGGLSAFSTMFGIAKSMKDMNDAVIRNQAVYDLTEQILAAQEKYAAAIERVRDLEREVAAFENWDAEQKRYQMKDFGGGTIAYSLKPEMASGDPPHNLCSACYQKGKKGILQPTGMNGYHQEMVKCAECGKDFVLGQRVGRSSGGRARTDYDAFTGR